MPTMTYYYVKMNVNKTDVKAKAGLGKNHGKGAYWHPWIVSHFQNRGDVHADGGQLVVGMFPIERAECEYHRQHHGKLFFSVD